MKKIFLGFIISTIFFLISCSKENNDGSAVDTEKVQEVLSFKGDPGARVVAFNILSPAEKAYALKNHITDNYKKLDLNESQIEFVKSILKIIVPEIYMKNSADKYAGSIATLGHQAVKLFSTKDYFLLFQNIRPIEEMRGNTLFLPAPGDCYCKWQSTCAGYADTRGPDCISGGCTSTETGCGFLWLSECTGICGRATN